MHSIPTAFFISFRCYGTWLHGDERGSVDKKHNLFGTPLLPPDAALEARRRIAMKQPLVSLDAQQRLIAEQAIRETCNFRGWELHALSARSNHVHVVLSAGDTKAETVLNALKANATRVMRQQGCFQDGHSPWSTGGSTRYLWTTEDLNSAIHYVAHGQE